MKTLEPQHRTLREALIAKQAENSETERAFAARLDVDLGNWFRFKNGQDMGVVFLGAVVRAYPELQLLVIEYIRSRPRRAQKPPATLSA
jgi:hypothetical protein